eukprot:TRINITY_DN6685_c0_g2_i1.p1 TRINITY_DN6685_c0_g2~~TRINITY_DN6685_c0_g2_i1.p1  ORF type:complete len:262 (+),score=45.65 TRINITY_DN6685_c0_g2_i1:154-939(+)
MQRKKPATYQQVKLARQRQAADLYNHGVRDEKKECIAERGRENSVHPIALQPNVQKAMKDQQKEDPDQEDMWGVLWRIVEWVMPKHTRPQWIAEKMSEMEILHNNGELRVLILQHPTMKLRDDGLRRVSRWLIEFNEQLEGLRRIDIAGNEAGFTGLQAAANALPLSCMEIDASGNAGTGWIKGATALASALRSRGGGVLYVGKAHKEDIPALKKSLTTISQVKGGEVQVHIFRWGATTEFYTIPTSTPLVPIVYARPSWG